MELREFWLDYLDIDEVSLIIVTPSGIPILGVMSNAHIWSNFNANWYGCDFIVISI